jgi:two-component system chemotaxis sensor kinase CheA
MVGIGSDRFILPMYAVREMFRPAKGVVTKVCVGGGSGSSDEVVDVRGSLLAVHRLDALLGVKSRSQSAEQGLLVVLENQSGHFCLLVDEFLGKQEVVIKPLGAMFRHVSGISAGAILGDGKVALILDIDGLFQRKAGPSGSRSADVALPLQELAHA